jgi:hypothetical protein
VKPDLRSRRVAAVVGLVLAFALIVPRILAYTPYARLGVTLDRAPDGNFKVASVVGPPARGLLLKGDRLLTVNGVPLPPPSARRAAGSWLPRDAFRLGIQRGEHRMELVVPPIHLSIWQRVRFLLFPLSAVFAAPLVAIVLFWRRPDLGTAAAFLWFAAAQAIQVVHGIYRFPEEEPTGTLKMVMGVMSGVVCWAPAAFLNFMVMFPRPRWRAGARLRNAWFWLVAVGYVVPLYFVYRLAATGSVASETFRVFESAALLIGVGSLLERVVRRSGHDWQPTRAQRVLLLATVAFYLAATTLDWLLRAEDLMPFMQLPLLQLVVTVVSVGTLLTPIAMAYLIARDPVFDPRRLVEKGLPYALLSGVLAALYLVVVLLGQRLFASVTGEQEVLFNVVAALVVAFAFAPLRGALQGWLDRLFRRDPMLLRASLDQAGRELLGALHPGEVRGSVESGLERGLGREIVVEWPEAGPPRLGDGEDLPDHVRGAVENLLLQAGIRLENLELQRQRASDERRAAELREAATRAELRALHAQVQPHFLFNALNALAYLIETDPPAAERFTGRLADMLRYSVEAGSRERALLSDEIGFVEDYLGVARERYEGELTFDFDGPKELLSTAVPPLLLQPLVENSLKYGYLPDHPRLHMKLEALRSDGWITLRFSDDGVVNGNDPGNGGRRHGSARGLGVGLDNLLQRIRRFGGGDATVVAGAHERGGFQVTMRWRDHDGSTN